MVRPFIVAELSCNHLGSLDRALTLIDAAADAGADAVKLQTWNRESMVLDKTYVIPAGPWAGRNLSELYDEAWTPWDWHAKLFEHARHLNIEAFSSPFDHKALAFLEGLECPRYKVSSFEIVDLPLIEAIARTGKPIVISTGMATHSEIWDAVREVLATHRHTARDLSLLKCTSAYPADASQANLRTMVEMSRAFGCAAGISDHTPGIGVAVAAAALGATIIEKHLTLLRSDGGPDAAFSMEPDEFKAMVTACRQAAAAIGDVKYGPTEAEMPQRALRRSLYAARAIEGGQIIGPEDVATARPAHGLPPSLMGSVVGARARYALAAGEPITSAPIAPRGT